MMKSLTTALASVLLGAWAPATHAQTIRHSTTTQTEELQALYRGITHIDVYANSAMHIRQGAAPQFVQVQLYRIDGMAMLEQEINVQLPQSEEAAYRWLQDNEAQFRARYEQRIQNAATGLSQAIALQIDRIPAIVINQRYVLYGMTDLDQVAKAFQEARP